MDFPTAVYARADLGTGFFLGDCELCFVFSGFDLSVGIFIGGTYGGLFLWVYYFLSFSLSFALSLSFDYLLFLPSVSGIGIGVGLVVDLSSLTLYFSKYVRKLY